MLSCRIFYVGLTFRSRHNLVIQLTNSLVDSRSNYAEVHPKILDAGNGRGRYPRDFELPKRLDMIYSLGRMLCLQLCCSYVPADTLCSLVSALERILESYGINTRSISTFDGPSPLGGGSRSDSPREARIRALLEFLGVNLSDNGRSDMSSSRSGGAFGQLPPRPGFQPDSNQSPSRPRVVFPRSRPRSSDLGYDPATQMPPRMNFLLNE